MRKYLPAYGHGLADRLPFDGETGEVAPGVGGLQSKPPVQVLPGGWDPLICVPWQPFYDVKNISLMFIYSYPPKASNNLIGSPFILASKYVSLIFLLRRLAIFQRQCEIQGKQIIKWLMFYQIQNVYTVALHTRSIIKVQSVQSTTYGCFVWLRRHFP